MSVKVMSFPAFALRASCEMYQGIGRGNGVGFRLLRCVSHAMRVWRLGTFRNCTFYKFEGSSSDVMRSTEYGKEDHVSFS